LSYRPQRMGVAISVLCGDGRSRTGVCLSWT
jgi:hypothetical protein